MVTNLRAGHVKDEIEAIVMLHLDTENTSVSLVGIKAQLEFIRSRLGWIKGRSVHYAAFIKVAGILSLGCPMQESSF